MKLRHLLLFTALLAFPAIAQQRYVGGDVSLLPTYEANGAKWMDENGKRITNMLDYLKQQGLNSLRVRLFVNPENAHKAHQMQGVRQNLDYVKSLCKRIKDAGFSLILDFHYSDTWADPGKQFTPKEWENLSDEELYQKIYEYTKDCLQQMVDAGATPDFIQTGNEISYGMLWGKGVITSDNYNASKGEGEVVYSYNDKSYTQCFYDNNHEANWSRFYKLLKKAGEACREVCPQARIILHNERIERPANIGNFMDRMQKNGVDYDIIGLSYYPTGHGSLSQLGQALNQTANYDKDVMIVETSYHYAYLPTDAKCKSWEGTPQGQAQYVKDLITKLQGYNRVIGLCWWPIECCENGLNWSTKRVTDGWCNSSLFNDTDKSIWGSGKVMPAMKELKSFLGDTESVRTCRTRHTYNGEWFTLQGTKIADKNKKRGLYIGNNKKIIIR